MICPVRALTETENKLRDIELIVADYKGKLVLFDDIRIRLPENSNLFKYEIRHDDEGWGEPVQLSTWILVNFYGTIISDSEIELPYKVPDFKNHDLINNDDEFFWYGMYASPLDLLYNKNYIISRLNATQSYYQYNENGIRI